jgi:Enoyl-CoA hydratase/isomerase
VSAQHGDLVTEHQDLNDLGCIGPGDQRQPAQNADEHQVDESEDHNERSCGAGYGPWPQGRPVAKALIRRLDTVLGTHTVTAGSADWPGTRWSDAVSRFSAPTGQPRAVGAARARFILLADRVVSAAEALDLDLVAAVGADDAVASEAEDLVERLAEGPLRALGRTKRLLREAAHRDLAAQLDAEAAGIADAAAGDEGREGREGVAALVDRRAPRFHG